jgi:hypothetical protein
MKSLTQLALAALIACSALATQAGPVSGYFRSNGTYVAPYYRTDAGSLGSSRSSSHADRNPCSAAPSVDEIGSPQQGGIPAAAVPTPIKVQTTHSFLDVITGDAVIFGVVCGGRHDTIPVVCTFGL